MRRLSVVLVVALAVAACKKEEPVQAQQMAGAGTPAVAGQPAAPGQEVKGKVVEKLDAPPYTYLKLETASGEAWAAVPKADVAAGAEVAIAGAVPME
jgi:hypothetical protein